MSLCVTSFVTCNDWTITGNKISAEKRVRLPQMSLRAWGFISFPYLSRCVRFALIDRHNWVIVMSKYHSAAPKHGPTQTLSGYQVDIKILKPQLRSDITCQDGQTLDVIDKNFKNCICNFIRRAVAYFAKNTMHRRRLSQEYKLFYLCGNWQVKSSRNKRTKTWMSIFLKCRTSHDRRLQAFRTTLWRHNRVSLIGNTRLWCHIFISDNNICHVS